MTIQNSEFAAFVRRKEREALTAALPPYVTVFDGPFLVSPARDDRPSCSLVFVQSADGNTGARDPGDLGGGDTDKHLIYEGLSRVAADAVMSGAETIRRGDIIFSVWHPELVSLRTALGKPRHPAQIVATLTGVDLDRGMMFNVPEIPVVVITVAPVAALLQNALAARPWITPVVMARASDLGVAFDRLRLLGIERVSCVGGRRIAAQLIDAGLVQDLYLTTSPSRGGEPDTPIHSGPLGGRVLVRKSGTGAETGVTFEHISLTGRRS